MTSERHNLALDRRAFIALSTATLTTLHVGAARAMWCASWMRSKMCPTTSAGRSVSNFCGIAHLPREVASRRESFRARRGLVSQFATEAKLQPHSLSRKMSALVAALDYRAALVRGENGSLEHKTTGDDLLDLFAKLVRGMPADALKDGVER